MTVGRRLGWTFAMFGFVVALSACAEPGPPPIELDRECELAGTPCVDGAYCHDAGCGRDRGTCVAMPDSCGAEPDPRCGCDGEVYEHACAAAMAGVSVGVTTCTPPAGMFACGDRFCAITTEYCEYIVGGGQPDAWRCAPLECPAGSSGCACLDPEPCPKDDLFFSQTCFVPEGGGTGVECLRP